MYRYCLLIFLSLITIYSSLGTTLGNWILSGTNHGFLDTSYTYEVISHDTDISLNEYQIHYMLNGQKLHTKGSSWEVYFDSIGKHTLQAIISHQGEKQILEKNIAIYDKQILYIGEESEFLNFGFEEKLNSTWYLLSLIQPKKFDLNEFPQLNQYIINSEIIIIHEKNFQPYLDKYIELKKNTTHPLTKQIILITDANQNLLKRSIAHYTPHMKDDEISIIRPIHLMNFLADLSLGTSYTGQSYSTSFQTNNQHNGSWFSLAWMVDELLRHGFPLQTLWLLLSLSVVALVIGSMRQIVGLSAFGMYWPLLLALIAHLIGLPLTLILLGIAIFSNILANSFSTHMYLLHSSKTSLKIALFLTLLIIGLYVSIQLGIDVLTQHKLELIMVIPIIMSVLISDKAFPNFRIWKKNWWISFSELFIVCWLSYWLLHQHTVSNLLLSYPDLLWLIIILNIVIGRFSGLQLLELIRFMPLIKKTLDQEEEE